MGEWGKKVEVVSDETYYYLLNKQNYTCTRFNLSFTACRSWCRLSTYLSRCSWGMCLAQSEISCITPISSSNIETVSIELVRAQ